MKTLAYILLGFLIISASGCEEKDVSPELGGYLRVNLETPPNQQNLSLVNTGLSPIENTNYSIDFRWKSIVYSGNSINYTSDKVLSGTYEFYYQIRTQLGSNTDDFSLSSPSSVVIQIFPGETRLLDIDP